MMTKILRGTSRVAAWCVLALTTTFVNAAHAEGPPLADFAWRATLALPADASLARIDVPVQALLHMQSRAAHDVRVFNAAGATVPFAVLAAADLSRTVAPVQTGSYKAYPLFAAQTVGKPARGTVAVQVDLSGQRSTAWVRWDAVGGKASTVDAGLQPLQAALFDLRSEKQTVDALVLKLDMPHNALVPISVATSADLKDWTAVAVKGPLFHFDGTDAPVNTTLELQRPLVLQGCYLRLAWPGQAGVTVRALTATVTPSHTAPAPLRADLPAGRADGTKSLSWTLPFATPISAIHLQAQHNNMLVPVRILGRAQSSQPWRFLTSSVVYRMDAAAQGSTQGSSNPPTGLHGESLHGLRVEPHSGMALPNGGLQASVEFAPMQVAFLASGAGPYTLAVGHAQAPAAAVAASLLGVLTTAKWADLPLATVAEVHSKPEGALDGVASRWLPDGVPLRTFLLWAVLGVGVLALGAVAYSLLRQMGTKQ